MPVSRRTVIGGLGLTSVLPSAFAVAQPDDPSFLKRGLFRGVGVFNPFGFAVGKDRTYLEEPYIHGFESWQAALPTPVLGMILQARFDGIRLSVDPAPLLAARDEPTVDRLLGQILSCVRTVATSGLRCIVNIHIQPAWAVAVPGWGDTDCIGDHDGKLDRLIEIESQLVRRLSDFCDPADVAIELFNEPPPLSAFNGSPWPNQLQKIFRAVRAAAPGHTLILSGTDYANAGTLSALDPKEFDSNTMFSFHCYEPYTFTFQSLAGGWIGGWAYLPYLRNVPFPPRAADYASARESLALSISRSGSLAIPDKFVVLGKGIKALSDYFETPQDEFYIASFISKATQWADAKKISRRRLFLGEFGCWAGEAEGADRAAKSAYLATVVSLAENAGICWSVHELEDPHSKWRVTDADRQFIPQYLAALQTRA